MATRLYPLAMLAMLPTLAIHSALAQAPSDSTLQAILTRRAASWKGPGIVVGVSEHGQRRYVAYGNRAAGGLPLDERTEFEIGSITKVYTSLLLANEVTRGEVRLEQPIGSLLPPGVRAPEHDGKPITLLDLSTHRSGLPRMPDNFSPADAENPYADYGTDRLYAFLSGYSLTRDPGAQYEYSNFGAGLLGTLLARKAGLSYPDALTRRILEPLGLPETRTRLGPEQAARLATGHTEALAPTHGWDFEALGPAGALRSTARDMLHFLEENLAPDQSPLARELRLASEPRRETTIPNTRIGLGWHFLERNGRSIVWHNGGTGGFHSFIGFERDSGRAVVVLANASRDIDDIGMHVLDPSIPLREPQPVSAHTEITVDPATLDRFVGEYQLAPTFSITITRENGGLWAQATGQQKLPIFPEAPERFFYKVVDAQLVFSLDPSGKVTGLTLHQNGNAVPGAKIR